MVECDRFKPKGKCGFAFMEKSGVTGCGDKPCDLSSTRIDHTNASHEGLTELRRVPVYIKEGGSEENAFLDLQVHLMEFNKRYGRSWSLTAPKRGRRKSAVIGKASDNNHLLYQDHVDAILAGVPKPLTVEAIRQKLVDLGEKPSTAKLLAPDYMRTIAKVLDPGTKRHRGSAKTLTDWGSE